MNQKTKIEDFSTLRKVIEIDNHNVDIKPLVQNILAKKIADNIRTNFINVSEDFKKLSDAKNWKIIHKKEKGKWVVEFNSNEIKKNGEIKFVFRDEKQSRKIYDMINSYVDIPNARKDAEKMSSHIETIATGLE